MQVFKGQNYIKDAYQKLAWHGLLQGNTNQYQQYMAACKQYGHALVAGDKSALKEAKQKVIPNATLLKARLLFDGGYYQKGYDLLQGMSYSDFPDLKSQLEFHYRLGRITHQLQRFPEAINFYQTTIEKGKNQTFFFACNAALQLAKPVSYTHLTLPTILHV